MAGGIQTFRDSLKQILPWWLTRGTIGKIVFAIGNQLDGLSDATFRGIQLRWPDPAEPDALALIGRDRRIRRGSDEAAETYATRLTRWLDDHRFRGGPYAMLAQLHAYYAAAPFQIDLVYQSGRHYSMATDGTVTRDDVYTGSTNPKWAHWTLFYQWPTAISLAGTWGSSGRLWGSGNNVWGLDPGTLDATQVADLRLIPTEWNAAHAQGTLVLLSPGSRVWGFPTRTWGSGGGTWGGTGLVVRIPIGI